MKKDISSMKIVQSNALVYGVQRMTTIQKKMVMYFIAKLQGDKAIKGRIYLTDLIRDLKLERKCIYGDIEKYTDQIMSYVVKLPHENDARSWTKVNWFHHIEYIHAPKSKKDKSHVIVQFHSELRRHIFNLKKCYAAVPAIYLNLQTVHAIRLFEIIWHLSFNLTKDSVEVDVVELKKMLGVEKLYSAWCDFERYAISPSVLNINELSLHNANRIRFALECTYIRAPGRGRRVTGIAFKIIKAKAVAPVTAPVVEAVAKPDPNAAKLAEYDEIIKLLKKADIEYTDEQYIEFIETNGGKEIALASIKYAMAEDSKYQKKNFGGWIITCIKKQKGKAIVEKRAAAERARKAAALKEYLERMDRNVANMMWHNPDADFDEIKAGLGAGYIKGYDERIKTTMETHRDDRKKSEEWDASPEGQAYRARYGIPAKSQARAG